MRGLIHRSWPVLLLVASGAVSSRVNADRVVLKGGTEIRGVVLPANPDQPRNVQILTATTSRPISFPAENLVRVIPENDRMSGYLDRLAQVANTAQGEYDMGLWCEEQNLPGPALRHFRLSLDKDASFGPAHEKVGDVLHNGRWMTQDERRAAQGLVKYKGRWVSAQEKEALTEQETFSHEQRGWAARLKGLRQQWLGGTPEQREQAEGELAAIREPAAALPLLRTFANDSPAVRVRLAQWLGGIEGPESRDALVRLILSEPETEPRQAYLHELQLRDEPETQTQLLKALEAADPLVVGRAAWALGILQVTSAVPRLINVLIKMEERMEFEEGPIAPNFTVGTSSIVGSSSYPLAGATVGSGASVGVNGGTGGAGLASGNMYTLPMLTGPVVAPGAVAFGAVGVPVLNGVAMGNGGSLRPSARMVTTVYRNELVHDALVKLTGVDFAYEVPLWRQWLTSRPSATPSTPQRRVRQP